MLGPVINVGALRGTLGLLLTVPCVSTINGLPAITAKDLLIDIMLRAGLNTCRLHTENGLIRCNAGQERIGAEALPVASALRYTSDVHHWPKSDVDTFADMFFTHRNAAGAE